MNKRLLLIIFVFFVSACKSNDSHMHSSTKQANTISSNQIGEIQNGWVQLSFDVSASGDVENIKIIDSYPAGRFDDEAVEALAKWKYKPKVENRVTVMQHNLKVQLDF